MPLTLFNKLRNIFRAHPAAAPLCGLALSIAFFFAPYIISGKILLLRGLFCFYYPRFEFLRERFSGGSFPLWNPFTGCGEPFLADIESQVLYPFNLLYLLFPAGLGTIVVVMIHQFIAGAGVYGACRTWNVSRTGAFFAGLVFVFSTAFVTKIEFLSMFESAAWLPVIIAAFAAWEKKRSPLMLALTACAVALQILAGYAEIACYAVLCLLLYALCAGTAARKQSGKWRAAAAPFAAIAVVSALGGLLAMAQILPTAEAMSLSANRGMTVDPELFRSSLHPLSLFSFLIPSVYGIPGWGGRYWAPRINEYWLGAHYIGIIPLIIIAGAAAAYAAKRFSRCGRERAAGVGRQDTAAIVFLCIVSVFSFLYALGGYAPFFEIVWNSFPLLHRFRWPPKMLICMVFALSCLAGISFDALGRKQLSEGHRPRSPGKALLPWTAAAAALVFAGAAFAAAAREGAWGTYLLEQFFNLGSVEKIFTHRIPWNALGADAVKCGVLIVLGSASAIWYVRTNRRRSIAAGALILLSAIDLAITDYPLIPAGGRELLNKKPSLAEKVNPPGRPVRFYEPRMKWILLYGERNEEAFDLARDFMLAQWPLAAKTYNAALQGNFKLKDSYDLQTIIENPGTAPETKKNLLGMMNCENYISFPNLLYLYAFKTLTPGKKARIEPALPRAFVAGGVSVLDSREDLFNEMAAAPVDFLSLALTDAGSAGGDTFPDLRPGRVTHTVTRVQDSGERLAMEVESLSAGILVVTDTFYPGWTAQVNGKHAKIYKVNGAFRGVRIPAGKSTVVMTYRPALFRIGVMVSIGTACLMTLLAAIIVMRKRKKRHSGGT